VVTKKPGNNAGLFAFTELYLMPKLGPPLKTNPNLARISLTCDLNELSPARGSVADVSCCDSKNNDQNSEQPNAKNAYPTDFYSFFLPKGISPEPTPAIAANLAISFFLKDL